MKKAIGVFLGLSSALILLNNGVLAASSSDTDIAGGLAASVLAFFSLFCSCFIYCIPLIIILGLLILEIFMIIDIVKRDQKDFGLDENSKLMWLLIVLLTGYIGTIIYYFMIYSKFKKKK